MKFKGLIFDFNGVLWWDTELQDEVWRKFAKKLAGRDVTQQELDEHMHGRPNKYFLEYLTGKSLSDDEIYKLTQEKESLYREECLKMGDDFHLSVGAQEVLEYLVDHKIPHTIATASEISNVNFFVAELKLPTWFEECDIVYDDGSRPGKPDPAVYLEAAKRIKLDPKDCVVVEDAKSGVIAASKAGIGRIYGLSNIPERAEALRNMPEVYKQINSFEEFPVAKLF